MNMIIELFTSWYTWWLDFWLNHPVIFIVFAVFAIGFSVISRRFQKKR